MRLLITLKIPAEIIHEIDAYRKKYNPDGLAHSHSHITLVPPFSLRGGFQDMVGDLDKHFGQHKPFRLKINGIGWFGNDVVFFKPNCPKALKALRASIKSLVGQKYRQRDSDAYWKFKVYRPHATIAHCDTPKNIRQYKEELKTLRYKRDFEVCGIELYAREGKKWILKHEFYFGSQAAGGNQIK